MKSDICYNHKICAYCGKEFLSFKKAKHGRRGGIRMVRGDIRPSNVLTCSKECSRKYTHNEYRRKHEKVS
jgi:hypothetical protein